MATTIVILALLSTFTQLLWIILGRVKAPRASWIVWFLIGVMQLIVSYGLNGWDTTSIMLGAYSSGNLFIVAYILLKNRGGWTNRETKILVATTLTMVAWLPFKIVAERDALMWASIVSQVLFCTAHFIGVWNHWVKVWSDPFTEAWDSWIFRLASLVITMISILQVYNLSDRVLYSKIIIPLYGMVTIVILLILIIYRRYELKRK